MFAVELTGEYDTGIKNFRLTAARLTSKNKGLSLLFSDLPPKWWITLKYVVFRTVYLSSPKSTMGSLTNERDSANVEKAWPLPLRERARSGLFLFNPVLPSYGKPYLTVEEQLDLLTARGMCMPEDRDQAANWLRRIGYYRLSGYWYPFRERKDGVALETFRSGTNLKHAFDLYVFDKRLRMLMLDAIERIEVGIRVDVAHILGSGDPWAHRLQANFNRYFNEADPKDEIVRHTQWLTRLDELCYRSSEDFAKRFREKYSGHFPIWIAIELWDFGTLAYLVDGLQDKDLQKLADKYALPRRTLLVSWIRSLNFFRNVCAHHGRLWNRPLIDQPAIPRDGEIPLLQHCRSHTRINSRIYAVASILQYFLKIMSPRSTWGERLKALHSEFPPRLASSGFPDGWREGELWKA